MMCVCVYIYIYITFEKSKDEEEEEERKKGDKTPEAIKKPNRDIHTNNLSSSFLDRREVVLQRIRG